MKTTWLVIAGSLALVVVFVLVGWLRTNRVPQQPLLVPTPATQGEEAFEVRSSAFDSGRAIPTNYTCDGADARPALSITGVPQDTKSFALVMYDPDSPGGTFVHWVAWNISPDMREIPEGPLPAGVMEGTTSFRSVGYQGPCPPSGTHRYIWRLYALRTVLSLDSNTTREDLESSINTYVITQTELMGRYTKK